MLMTKTMYFAHKRICKLQQDNNNMSNEPKISTTISKDITANFRLTP